MKLKPVFLTFLGLASILFVLWIATIGIDYWVTVHTLEKPLFAGCKTGYDDGGSGIYAGPGYSIEVIGDFMPSDDPKGVTNVEFYIFNHKVAAASKE